MPSDRSDDARRDPRPTDHPDLPSVPATSVDPLLSGGPIADEPGAALRPTARPGPIAILGLSAWCGLLVGLLEVATVVVHKRFLDTNQLLSMSRQFVGLIPLTDLLIFLLVGSVGVLAVLIRPEGGRWVELRVLAALTLLPVLLVAVPQVHAIAWLLVALGVSARLVPILERRGPAFRRVVVFSTPILVLTLAGLAATPFAADRAKQWREQSRPIPSGSPNILLVVMDTVAADHLALYGYGRPTSPALDELARRGSRFDAAQPSSSWTLASHASMFTGRWPHELSVGWRTPLDDARPTIAEFLRDRGYATAGFVANTSYCAADSGLGRGFTVYEDYIYRELSPFRWAVMVRMSLDALQAIADGPLDALDLTRPRAALRDVRERFETDRKEAAVVNREFLDWLADRRQPERPYFAFLNYFDAHSPYQLPARRIHRFGTKPIEERQSSLIRDWWTVDKRQVAPDELAFVRDAYDDCVASIDEQVGRLFDELGRRGALDRTWVILVSDHGESFGEHEGVYVHGSSLYQTELHVPLVVIPPAGVPVRPVVAETTSLRDMAATIADLAGWGGESPFPGGSMARLWQPSPGPTGGGDAERRAIAELIPNETLAAGDPGSPRQPGPLSSMTAGGWSYIRREGEVREELYHLSKDPREQQNVAASPDSRPLLERMRETLSRMTLGPLTRDRFNP